LLRPWHEARPEFVAERSRRHVRAADDLIRVGALVSLDFARGMHKLGRIPAALDALCVAWRRGANMAAVESTLRTMAPRGARRRIGGQSGCDTWSRTVPWEMSFPASEPRPGAPSILLVVVDTLRADRVGVYSNKTGRSPHLDRRAPGAAIFERAYAPSPWTVPTFGSILTGRMPSEHRGGTRSRWNSGVARAEIDDTGRLDRSLPTLAGTLARAGYATAAVVDNPVLHPDVGLDGGFGVYRAEKLDMEAPETLEILRWSLSWMVSQGSSPFFLMINLIDPHLPYDALPPFRGSETRRMNSRLALPFNDIWPIRAGELVMNPQDEAFVTAAYGEEVAALDDALGGFFRDMEQRGVSENLMVVLTSDHGEELFDHGGFEHGHTVYDELLHVPLLVWGPGVVPGRIGEPVSLVDLFATICDASGVVDCPATSGVSLWPRLSRGETVKQPMILAESTLYGPEQKAAIVWPYKMTYDLGSKRERIFNLQEDPGEMSPLASEPGSGPLLRAAIDKMVERTSIPTETIQVGDAMRERLRSLGYFIDDVTSPSQ
jgi:arylsulfatase A-like enzyme